MTSHIAVDNHLLPSRIVTQSNFATGYEFDNALGGETSRRAKVEIGSTGVVDFDFGAAKAIDCLCVARHNFGTTTAQIDLSTSADGSDPWTMQETITFSNDKVSLVTFTEISAQHVRLSFSGHVGVDLIVSDIVLTKAMVLPRPMPDSFTPPEFGIQSKVKSNITSGNQLSGLTLDEKPLKTKIPQKHVPAAWMFANYLTIANGMMSRPAYWRWKESGSTMFCWLAGTLQAPKYKKIMFMDFNITVEGFVE